MAAAAPYDQEHPPPMNRPAADNAREEDTEEALRAAEQRWRRLYEHVPVGLFELDARGQLSQVNPAVLAMLGDTDAAALRRRLAEGRVFRQRRQLLAWLRALTRADTVRGMELTLGHVDGSDEHLVATCAPVRDERGLLRGYEGSFTDVTPLKALEQQVLLVRKMEAVGQLTGGIAHDFNNLLTIINGNLYLMEQELGAEHPLAATLATTRQAATQGADLTRSLIAFARRETPEPEAIDLDERVEALRPLLERALEGAAELRIEPAGVPARVWADAAQFESALLNLALNARDAMPEGGVFSVTVTREEAGPDGGPGWLITVHDTGRGMTEAVLERVFEPFFTTRSDGSGLGLAMVQRFAIDAGGRVTVESRPGAGTTFRLRLPAGDD